MTEFWKGRRVLVAGGNGFIGSHLVEMLIAAGARVTATASDESTRFRFLDRVRDDVETVVGDLGDAGDAARAVKGQDVVMHLAARVGGIAYNIAHPGSIFRENMRTFMTVLEAARVADVERFLVTSSACVYPRHCAIPTPETEGFVGRPEETNEGYGWAKRMEEFLGAAYAREHGMTVRVARPYNAYGPRDTFDPERSHVIPALIRRVLEGENPVVVWGDGTVTRSFLYVSDFAAGLAAVAERAPDAAAINIGADEEVSVRQLVETIVELSGRRVELRFDASKPGGQPRRRCDTTRARQVLGWQARVPLRDGLAETIAWYREASAAGAVR